MNELGCVDGFEILGGTIGESGIALTLLIVMGEDGGIADSSVAGLRKNEELESQFFMWPWPILPLAGAGRTSR
jgi:hypothetical protein